MDRRLLPPPTHLPRSLHIHKLLKDPMGLGNQLCSWPGLLELLTGQPEFQVLLAELCLQEGAECSHPICGCGGRGKGRQIGRGLSSWTAEAREKGSHNVRPALTVQAPLPHSAWRLYLLNTQVPLETSSTWGSRIAAIGGRNVEEAIVIMTIGALVTLHQSLVVTACPLMQSPLSPESTGEPVFLIRPK